MHTLPLAAWLLVACFGPRDDPALLALADGQVLYTSSGPQGRGVYLYRQQGPLTLVAPGADEPHDPTWSPDGQRIAYFVRNGAIRAVGVDGSAQGDLVAAGVSPSWSPDGTLAWTQDRNVWIRPPGGEPQPLPLTGYTVTWSPTGQHLAVKSDRVVIATPDGTTVASGQPHRIDTLQWSPDGAMVIASGGRVELVGIDGSQRFVSTPAGFASHAAFSPDGAFISYTVLEPGNSDWPYLVIDALDGSSRQERSERGYDFLWSADGTALLYYSMGHLALTRVDGSGRAQLTRGPGQESDASWRPR